MAAHNPENERIKRRYFIYLKEAKRQSEASVDAAAAALARFEASTRHRDFKAFHVEQAVAFKGRMAEIGKDGKEKLSKATRNAILAHLKRFFQWLSQEPGYRSHLTYSNAEYFNLSEKDTRVANARRERPAPTLEQMKHAIAKIPGASEIERRNRALMAFALLTGARDGAIASLKLKHIDLQAGCVYQDARDVLTKFSKTFTTYFFPVGEEAHQIFADWVYYLRDHLMWGGEDPLFPATLVALGEARQFQAVGLQRAHWSTTTPIRAIFRDAFKRAGLRYFNPHSIRKTLARLGETCCKTPEEFKAWSQNLGHEEVLTTFCSYGNVATRRQGELIKGLASPREDGDAALNALAQAVMHKLRANSGLLER